jgi:hypothetical protein
MTNLSDDAAYAGFMVVLGAVFVVLGLVLLFLSTDRGSAWPTRVIRAVIAVVAGGLERRRRYEAYEARHRAPEEPPPTAVPLEVGPAWAG